MADLPGVEADAGRHLAAGISPPFEGGVEIYHLPFQNVAK